MKQVCQLLEWFLDLLVTTKDAVKVSQRCFGWHAGQFGCTEARFDRGVCPLNGVTGAVAFVEFVDQIPSEIGDCFGLLLFGDLNRRLRVNEMEGRLNRNENRCRDSR